MFHELRGSKTSNLCDRKYLHAGNRTPATAVRVQDSNPLHYTGY